MNFLDSLVARTLKSRYYPTIDFLNASIGRSPSFVWKGILALRQLLEEGMTWRVGDGSNIIVWQDPWLYIPHDAKLHTPPHPNSTNLCVANLILSTPQRWNVELLQMLSTEHDIKAIQQILLSIRHVPDHIGWQFTKSGDYSVKSGYRLALQLHFPTSPLPSDIWNDC